MTKQLKLRGESEADLATLSALLQDAAFTVGDIAWSPSDQRFAAVCNRFRWEAKKRLFRWHPERVRCAFHFSGVLNAELMGINPKETTAVLSLLAIRPVKNPHGDMALLLDFSGAASIRLTVETIDVVMSDVSDSWEALSQPRHK